MILQCQWLCFYVNFWYRLLVAACSVNSEHCEDVQPILIIVCSVLSVCSVPSVDRFGQLLTSINVIVLCNCLLIVCLLCAVRVQRHRQKVQCPAWHFADEQHHCCECLMCARPLHYCSVCSCIVTWLRGHWYKDYLLCIVPYLLCDTYFRKTAY